MSASSSTLEIDGIGLAPDTHVFERPRLPPPKTSPAAESRQPTPPPEPATCEIDGELPAPRFRLLTIVPGWLVSLTVHLVGVLVLAAITIPPVVKQAGTFLEAAPIAEETAEVIVPAEIQAVELKSLDLVVTAVGSEAVMSESVGDAGQLAAVAANLAVPGVDTSPQAEIGDLFAGQGGKAMGSSLGSDAKSAAQFFGIKATGRRFVFIVDSSNSMRGGKFAAAKEELLSAIRRLSKDQAFYVIFFDRDAERMLLPPDKEPPLLPVLATSDNIYRVERWIATVQNELRTDPFDAVKFALDMVPDAIYLLSDGKFTDRGLTVRYLKNNNLTDDPSEGYRPKVVVHTICFWQREGEETMKAIAKDYGGTYRFVPPGKK